MRSSHTEYSSVLQGYQRQIKYAVRTDFHWTDSICKQPLRTCLTFFHISQAVYLFLLSLFHNSALRCFLKFGQIMQFPAQAESAEHVLSVGDKM